MFKSSVGSEVRWGSWRWNLMDHYFGKSTLFKSWKSWFKIRLYLPWHPILCWVRTWLRPTLSWIGGMFAPNPALDKGMPAPNSLPWRVHTQSHVGPEMRLCPAFYTHPRLIPHWARDAPAQNSLIRSRHVCPNTMLGQGSIPPNSIFG